MHHAVKHWVNALRTSCGPASASGVPSACCILALCCWAALYWWPPLLGDWFIWRLPQTPLTCGHLPVPRLARRRNILTATSGRSLEPHSSSSPPHWMTLSSTPHTLEGPMSHLKASWAKISWARWVMFEDIRRIARRLPIIHTCAKQLHLLTCGLSLFLFFVFL